MEPKGNSIELSMFLKYGLTKVKKAPSQMFEMLSVSITLNLTFPKRTKFQPKRNKIPFQLLFTLCEILLPI